MDATQDAPTTPTGYLDPNTMSSTTAAAAAAAGIPTVTLKKAPNTTSGYGSSDDADSTSYDSDEEEARQAQKDWEESVEQMQLLFTTIVFPIVGRWAGRKFIFWGYDVYSTRKFTLLPWLRSLLSR